MSVFLKTFSLIQASGSVCDVRHLQQLNLVDFHCSSSESEQISLCTSYSRAATFASFLTGTGYMTTGYMQSGYMQTGYIQSGYMQTGYMETYVFHLKYEALLKNSGESNSYVTLEIPSPQHKSTR